MGHPLGRPTFCFRGQLYLIENYHNAVSIFSHQGVKACYNQANIIAER